MLDEYIKELIASNNRVIIPNFGAFLLRATSKNKNRKELSAKINDIYFSPFLKFNDELLMSHVIKKENLTQKEAMDMITKYISTIENSVKENGAYQIEGFGQFYMDNQGKIQFKIQPTAQKEESKEEKQDSAEKESEPKEPEKTSSTINEKAARRKKTVAESKAEEKKEESPEKEEKKEAPESQKKPPQKAKSGKGARKAPPPPPKKQKAKAGSSGQKGNKGLILSVVIGVPVAVIFVWAMLNFDTVQSLFSGDDSQMPVTEKMETANEEQTDQQEQDQQDQSGSGQTGTDQASGQDQEQGTGQDMNQQNTQADQTAEQGSAGQQQIRQASGGKKYYVVAGSFKNKQNAVNFHKKLLNQGYDSEMIGERDGMHAVSYASFQSKNRAQRELQRLRNDEGVQAWLLYY
jgi:nucleoid DNA-binding protein